MDSESSFGFNSFVRNFSKKGESGKMYELVDVCQEDDVTTASVLITQYPTLLNQTVILPNGIKCSMDMYAFIAACRAGCLDIAKLLLNESKSNVLLSRIIEEDDLGTKISVGCCALINALSNNHIHIARWLLKESPNIIHSNISGILDFFSVGITALIEACKNGHDKIVKFLLENYPIRIASRERALLCVIDQAFYDSNTKVAEALLERFPALIKELSLNTLIKTLAYQTFSRNCNVSEKHLTDQYESLWMGRYELLSDNDKFMLRIVNRALENRKSKATWTKIIPQFIPQEHIKESKDWITLIEKFAD